MMKHGGIMILWWLTKMITLIQVYTSNLRMMEHDKNMFTTCQSKIQTYFFICKILTNCLDLGLELVKVNGFLWAKVKGPSWIQTNSFRKKEKIKSSEIAKIAKTFESGAKC